MIDEVISKLPTLETKDLKKLVAAANHILKSRDDLIDQANPDWELLHDSIQRTLTKNGVKGGPMLKQSGLKKEYGEKYEEVEKYVWEHFRHLNRVQKIQLFNICAAILYKNLADWGKFMSYRTMILNVDKIPTFMENAFPGYAKAGVLDKIIDMRRE